MLIQKVLPRYITLNSLHIPSSGGVCFALWGAGRAGAVGERHSRRRIGLGNSDLFRLADLLSAVWTKALPVEHRGTGSMKPVGDVHLWLTLHEDALHDGHMKYLWVFCSNVTEVKTLELFRHMHSVKNFLANGLSCWNPIKDLKMFAWVKPKTHGSAKEATAWAALMFDHARAMVLTQNQQLDWVWRPHHLVLQHCTLTTAQLPPEQQGTN